MTQIANCAREQCVSRYSLDGNNQPLASRMSARRAESFADRQAECDGVVRGERGEVVAGFLGQRLGRQFSVAGGCRVLKRVEHRGGWC